ncbi:MAG: histidinol-phosphatase [Alphaproteobacteria bacterium]|nr:histidinol-phosphatase [Alphaproteobacteria bacterium]
METCPEEWIALAHRLADIARPIAKQFFRTPLDIISKADDSPVTIADRSIEAAMRAEIEKTFPDHGILGEEYGSVRLDGPAVWVLDPIDGTKAFISGMPLFGTLIACCVGGIPVLGIIDQPIQEERWVGANGHATTYNGTPVHTSQKTALAEAIFYTTDADFFLNGPDKAGFLNVKNSVALTRFSADCYAYALIASGSIDLVIEMGLQPYDYCALAPVINGAGGSVTDWDGNPISIHSDGRVIAAANAELREAALQAFLL